ncbi:hypothetical protein AB1N83_001327 [Pleurotus pulmonarius]
MIHQPADISTIHYHSKGIQVASSQVPPRRPGRWWYRQIPPFQASPLHLMVSKRGSSQRRRSQTTTATICHAPRRTIDDAYRAATKRAHRPRASSPSSLSDDSSSSNWDLDIWRQAKRLRRDSLPSARNGSHMDIDHFTAMSSTSSGTATRRTTLPSTSIAFQLFPMTGRRSTKTRRSSCQSDSGDIALNDRNVDLRGLRTSALWELHRSVAESGEGFVRRMQDLENSLSRPDILSKGRESPLIGKRRSSINTSPPCSGPLGQMSDCSDDDDDDVQILDGGLGVNPWSQLSNSFPDSTQIPLAYCADDEEATSSSISVHSSPSTTASIPFPSSESSASLSYSADPPALEYSPSRSDKALAALTLALANGAAGLTDFAAVQALHVPLAMDECQVGDMWD